MINNLNNKNKKIWYAIIIVAVLSVLVIGLILLNKLGTDRDAQKVNIDADSSQSISSVSSSSSNSTSFGDTPNEIDPPSLTL